MLDVVRGAWRAGRTRLANRMVRNLNGEMLLFLAGITAGVGGSLFSDRLLDEPLQRGRAILDLALFGAATHQLIAAKPICDKIQRRSATDTGDPAGFVTPDLLAALGLHFERAALALGTAAVLLLGGW